MLKNKLSKKIKLSFRIQWEKEKESNEKLVLDFFLKQSYWDIIHIPYNSYFESVQFSGFLIYSQSYTNIATINFRTLFITSPKKPISTFSASS